MDRTEKLNYEQGMEQYFDKNKVYDLFEKLFKDLIINQPENYIDYLIERLKSTEIKRIFITGYPWNKRKEVCERISNSLGFEYLFLEDELKKLSTENSNIDDDIIIDFVRNKLVEFEEQKKSYIIEGYPSNRVQAIFLQTVGLLPDNVIILKNSRQNAVINALEKIKEKFPDKTEEELYTLANNEVDEIQLGIGAVEDVFNGFYCELPLENYDNERTVIEELGKLLKFKEKSNASRRPPRIILACPPSLGKDDLAKKLVEKFQIIHVSVLDLLKKEIGMMNSNSREILRAMKHHQLVPDKIVLKLLEDRLFCSDCMINGWIVTGFPMNESQIHYIEHMDPAIKPSLLAYVDINEDKLLEKSKRIRVDLRTGRHFKIASKKYNALGEDIRRRLIEREQDKEEIIKKRIEIWKKITEKLIPRNWLKLNGEEKKKRLVQLIEDEIRKNGN